MTGRRDATHGRWTFGRLLRVGAAVREDVLATVPTERRRYTAMGVVVLSNGLITTLSISVVLYFALDRFEPWIIPVAVLWGLLVVSLDRWMISSSGPGLRRFLPRLLLSLAWGVVIAEPLLVGVYHAEIESVLEQDRMQAGIATTEELRRCNPVPGSPESAVSAPANCAKLRLVVPDEEFTNLVLRRDALQAQVADLEKVVETDTAALDQLERYARDECNGVAGPGLSGQAGVGFNCRRLREDADRYRFDHNVDENTRQLTDLRAQLRTVQNGVFEDQLRFRNDLNESLAIRASDSSKQVQPVGLLDRIRALDHLVAQNGYVFATLWIVRILVVLLDTLPIQLRVLGGKSAYDYMLHTVLEHDKQVDRLKAIRDVDMAVEGTYTDERPLRQRLLAGPGAPLANYHGWISVSAISEFTNDGPPMGLTQTRRLVLDHGQLFELAIWISPEPTATVAEPLIVTNGVDRFPVEFTVEVDSDQPSLRRSWVPVLLETANAGGEVRFSLGPVPDQYEFPPWLWIRVSQGRRTLQNIELSVELLPIRDRI